MRDDELSWRNLELLKEQGDADKPIAIVRMRTQELVSLMTQPLQIFVPIAA